MDDQDTIATEAKEGRQLTITILNEDDGRQYQLQAGPGTPIHALLQRFYAQELNRERRPDDRLRCEADGEDVFQFNELHLRDYLEAGHCVRLIWRFASASGGA